MNTIQWPEKKEYRTVFQNDLGAAAWFVLNELFNKSEKSRASLTVPKLAGILNTSAEKLDEARSHPLLIYDPKKDSLAPFVRTEIPMPELFFDERDLHKKLELKDSPIHGTGCFARINFHKGQIIRNSYKGVLRYLWELDDWSREADCYNMTCPLLPEALAYCPLDQDATPSAAWQNPYIFYANQQDPPQYPANVRYYESKKYPWMIWLKALASIRVGDEILVDTYGSSYDF